MSQITSYSALYPQLTLDLPGCPQRVMLAALQRAGREFARDSRSFRMRLDPLPVTDHQADYNLSKGKVHNYDAQIRQLLYVAINGVPVNLWSIELFETQWLRLGPTISPVDEDTERLLVCGTAGIITHSGGWTDITDGSVTFTVDSSTYEATDLDFSACASMDDVARVIETGWRTAMDENTVYVRWAEAGTNKFLLWTDAGEITYLTAGTSGTDISGAGHMNGLTDGTGVQVAPILEIDAVLVPDIRTDTLPDWFLDRHADTIAARATVIIASQPRVGWSNAELAAMKQYEYLDGLQRATMNNEKRDLDVLARIL